eukprot:Skav215533  [mRNA]  locus=scaffold4176:16903:17897:+ [translate_table: standard]
MTLCRLLISFRNEKDAVVSVAAQAFGIACVSGHSVLLLQDVEVIANVGSHFFPAQLDGCYIRDISVVVEQRPYIGPNTIRPHDVRDSSNVKKHILRSIQKEACGHAIPRCLLSLVDLHKLTGRH